MAFSNILKNLPEVKKPTEKKLGFNVKLKWTLIILVAFFILANTPLFGLGPSALSRFEYLAILLGTDFGSIISLGIGPIVMGSIILQLLSGVQIIKIDTKTEEGKMFYQGLNKLMAFAFVILEAVIYVMMKGLEALPGMEGIVIAQLCIGGFLIIFMDEVVQKWGFGSGVSLFIAAGIGWRLFSQLFQFMSPQGRGIELSGKILVFFQGIAQGDMMGATLALVAIAVTVILFLIVVWAQSLKVEIPLAFDRVRGYGIKWPLPFFYAGVIPVILVSALTANLQLFGSLLENSLGRATFLGSFVNGVPTSGLAFWLHYTQWPSAIITESFRMIYFWQGLTHVLFYVVFSIVFSFFWVMTSNMDAASQAKKIMGSGLSIPGFRRDERVLETILKRYVGPLTIMGGAAIGLLASIADLSGALVGGTAILLVIMVLYQLYQNIAQQHAVDMNPALAGFFKGI